MQNNLFTKSTFILEIFTVKEAGRAGACPCGRAAGGVTAQRVIRRNQLSLSAVEIGIICRRRRGKTKTKIKKLTEDFLRISWGRCYNHNFLRFLSIFGEKMAFFLKNQYNDQLFAKTSSSLSKKCHFSPFVLAKIFLKS
jgi:hypothetical protein